MESTRQERTQRKKIQKHVFSPSEYDRYVLIFCSKTDEYKIVKQSDVISETDGQAELKSGDFVTLVLSGTLAECRTELKVQQQSQKRKETFIALEESSDEEHDDEQDLPEKLFNAPSSSSISYIQRPPKGFQTPGVRRRNNSIINEISSPYVRRRQLNTVVDSNQNPSHTLNSNDHTKRFAAARKQPSKNQLTNSIVFNGNDSMDMDTYSALDRLQCASEGQSTLIHGLKDEVGKLRKRMERFFNSSSSKNELLSSYRDANDTENYPDEIMYNNENLLNISGRDPADYARTILRRLFTSEELTSSILPSRYAHLYRKKILEQERLDILNKAIRTQYRISKNNYASFYSAIIQKTLSDCIYNEGPRKQPKNSADKTQVGAQGNATAPVSIVDVESSPMVNSDSLEYFNMRQAQKSNLDHISY